MGYILITPFDPPTIVWEKLMVGNIHEKKFMVKNFRLSRLQTKIF